MAKQNTTNAMRILDKQRIEYTTHSYAVHEDDFSGETVAHQIDADPNRVFKTLVLKGDKTGFITACIPVPKSLDLKAMAQASGNKKVEMINVNTLRDVTGYIRGGCSPIGMKKTFPTYICQSAEAFETIIFSAGQRGLQIETSPDTLLRIIEAKYAQISI